MTTIANGFCVCEPMPCDSAAGKRPSVATSVVIRTGRNRRSAACRAASITVLQATAEQPGRDPDGGALYHHLTVCLSVDVPVAVLAHGGLAFTHHLHACAQSAAP